MAKGEAKRNNQLMDQERARVQSENTQFQNLYGGERSKEYDFSQGLRGDILKGYKDLAGGQFSGGASGGGYTATNYAVDPSQLELEGRYKTLSGGLDRALPQYEDWAKTGGFTDADTANFRARGISPVSAFYGNLKNELNRRSKVSGYNPGFGSSMARLAREGAIGAGKAGLDTEVQLSSQRRQGQLAGLSGMERIGTQGYAGVQNVADLRQRIAEMNAAEQSQAANANAAASASAGKYADAMKLAGLGGMMDVYGSNPAELARYDEMLMQNRGLVGNQIGGNLGLRVQNNPNVSTWDRITGLVGAGAGLAGAFTNPAGAGLNVMSPGRRIQTGGYYGF